MNEPLFNPDTKLRAEMRIELQNLQDQLTVTIVYATHNQTKATMVVDRIAVMDDDELQQAVSSPECYHELNDPFVAELIGEPIINLICGTHSEPTFAGEYFLYLLNEDVVESVDNRDDFVLGTRPEDIGVADVAPDDAALDDHDFQVDVTIVKLHGGRNTLHSSRPDQPSVDGIL